METYYLKKGKRYVAHGVLTSGNLHPNGLWLINGNAGSSCAWLVGELKEPQSVIDLLSLQILSDPLSYYIEKLKNPESEEAKELKKLLGGYMRDDELRMNISSYDLARVILRQIGLLIENKKNTNSFNKTSPFNPEF